MYSALSRLGFAGFARKELVPFAVAVVVAEMFFKFHSFSLECLAFLATWYVLSALQHAIERALKR